MATICHHHVVASTLGLRRKGLDEQALYDHAAIHPVAIASPKSRVHTDQVARLFKSVMIALDDEYMGFTPRPLRVGVFAMMAELVSQVRTLRELLQKGCHFYSLITDDIRISLSEDRGEARLSILHRAPEYDPQHFLAEFLLVIWHRFSSWYIGSPISLNETRFAFKSPEHAKEIQIMFPGRQVFGCLSNALIFDSEYLDRPLIRNRLELAAFLSNAPADFMTIPGVELTIENRISHLLRDAYEQTGEWLGLEGIASELGMSAQTLHRRLQEERTNFQHVKDALRREISLEYLLDSHRSVEEISQLVGFQEARSFTRAFRTWTGVSPRQYRQRSMGA